VFQLHPLGSLGSHADIRHLSWDELIPQELDSAFSKKPRIKWPFEGVFNVELCMLIDGKKIFSVNQPKSFLSRYLGINWFNPMSPVLAIYANGNIIYFISSDSLLILLILHFNQFNPNSPFMIHISSKRFFVIKMIYFLFL
jgi:hypothetical protein